MLFKTFRRACSRLHQLTETTTRVQKKWPFIGKDTHKKGSLVPIQHLAHILMEATTHAVYSVTCKTCNAEYIGETQRAFRVRGNEHRDAVRLGHCSKSAVAEHVHNYKLPHEVDLNSLKLMDKSKIVRNAQFERHSISFSPNHIGTGMKVWKEAQRGTPFFRHPVR